MMELIRELLKEGEVIDFAKAKQLRNEKKKKTHLQLAKERLKKMGYRTKD